MMHFSLGQIPLQVHLGVPDSERAQKQEVHVWVHFDYDVTKASVSDNIDETVDYQAVYDFLKAFPGNRKWKLVEKLHSDLEKALEEKFPQAKDLKITIEKKPWKDASVIITH